VIERSLLGLERALTQQAEIERNQATVADDWGGEGASDWQPLATVPCFLWWGTSRSTRGIGSVDVGGDFLVDLNAGGMIVPEGTDITAHDRIGRVLAQDATTVIAERLEILAVAPFEGLTEIGFRKIS